VNLRNIAAAQLVSASPRKDKNYRENKKAIILSNTPFPKLVPFTIQLQEKRQCWRRKEWSEHNVTPERNDLLAGYLW
jgi:hypothetical protein